MSSLKNYLFKQVRTLQELGCLTQCEIVQILHHKYIEVFEKDAIKKTVSEIFRDYPSRTIVPHDEELLMFEEEPLEIKIEVKTRKPQHKVNRSKYRSFTKGF